MSHKLIIITADADKANLKIINRLLLTLRDWEFGDDPSWDDCVILKDITAITSKSDTADLPPLQELPTISFRGTSTQEIENLMLTKHKEGAASSLFLLLDNEGVDSETIIIAARAINPDSMGMEDLYLDIYDKVRVPWIQAHSMWCNLDISNMGFEDFCEEEETTEDGWRTYQEMMGEGHYDEFLRRRDVVVRELVKLDLA